IFYRLRDWTFEPQRILGFLAMARLACKTNMFAEQPLVRDEQIGLQVLANKWCRYSDLRNCSVHTSSNFH
ncbi:hypothetical protein ABTH62_20500, partial [Acinetobacter baumannii]